MKPLTHTLEAIRRKHRAFPRAADVTDGILAFERRTGYRLPEDLCGFFAEMDGADLFKGRFVIPGLSELVRVRIAIGGPGLDSDEYCPSSWYAICDVEDGNFLAIDLAPPGFGRILDCFHETFAVSGYRNVVAITFNEFLNDALNSHGRHYYLDPAFKGHGYI
jgi:hypothetical protein